MLSIGTDTSIDTALQDLELAADEAETKAENGTRVSDWIFLESFWYGEKGKVKSIVNKLYKQSLERIAKSTGIDVIGEVMQYASRLDTGNNMPLYTREIRHFAFECILKQAFEKYPDQVEVVDHGQRYARKNPLYRL